MQQKTTPVTRPDTTCPRCGKRDCPIIEFEGSLSRMCEMDDE